MRVGFIGLGIMGQPMALNLARAGIPLTVWNRSIERTRPLQDAGAHVADSSAALITGADIIVLMLATEQAMDTTLNRDAQGIHLNLSGKIVVNMGTVSPHYSQQLGQAIQEAGGEYVEAPVSGSRKPAESGNLVLMLAGQSHTCDRVAEVLKPLNSQHFQCGQVPQALRMKLAVNTFLITLVTGLAESFHFAQSHGLDLHLLRAILDAGPMASDVSRMKTAKLAHDELEAQAAISDVLKNSRLVVGAARDAGQTPPLMTLCSALFEDAESLGFGNADMVAVLKAIEARSQANNLKQ